MPEQPWDIPPFPTHGDQTDRETYAAVGRAMSHWEAIEVEFAQLYARLSGASNPFDETLSQEYGAKDNFRSRVDGLDMCAFRYSVSHPDQEFEGDLAKVLADVCKFSARRNDIAHGIVRPIYWTALRPRSQGTPGQPPLEWCLAPPHFRGKNFEAGRPRFLFAAAQIDRFAEAFFSIQRAANDLVHRLLGTHYSFD